MAAVRTDLARHAIQAAVGRPTMKALSGWPLSNARPSSPASAAAARVLPDRHRRSAASSRKGRNTYALECGCSSQSVR